MTTTEFVQIFELNNQAHFEAFYENINRVTEFKNTSKFKFFNVSTTLSDSIQFKAVYIKSSSRV